MPIFVLQSLTDELLKHGFYKIIINNNCPFDDFCNEIEKGGNYQEDLDRIQTIMEVKAIGDPIPTSKWQELKRDKKDKFKDYEIKSGRLRVYLFIDEEKGFIVVTGGVKKPKDQEKAIDKMRRIKKRYFENK